MPWIIPTLLLVAAMEFLRSASQATGALVAWRRFIVAVFLLLLAAIYGVVIGVQWVVG